MIELEHSPLGGSSAHRFMSCVGYFLLYRQQLLDGTFENVESEFAKLGTGAHELGAVCLAGDTEPYEHLGEEFNGYLAGWPDGIDLDAVQVYVSDCRTIMEANNYDGLAIVEKTYHHPSLHPLLKGTVDFAYVSPRGIWLRDYKNGEGIGVHAIGSRQLLYYAFLLLVAYEAKDDNWDRDTPINMGIVQPNFWGLYEAPEIWELTLGEVYDWGYDTLLPLMHARTNAPDVITDDDFVPGDHCQFCPVLLDCPKMQAAYIEYTQADEEFVAMLTNEELSHYWGIRDQARRFMNVLETTVHARMMTGGDIPTAKLVEKRVNRQWKPGGPAAMEAAFGEKAWEPRKIKSPAQVEKLSSRGKEMALEWGYKPESPGFSVAAIGDPRPEAKPRTSANVFADHIPVDKPVDTSQF